MQRARWFVEYFAWPKLSERTVVDFHFVGAFEYIAERVAARVTVWVTAISWIALGSTDCHHAAKHVAHRCLEELYLAGSGSGRLRLRIRLQGRDRFG